MRATVVRVPDEEEYRWKESNRSHPKIMRLKIQVSFLGQHFYNGAIESYNYMEIK
jgi:hypothetical protein